MRAKSAVICGIALCAIATSNCGGSDSGSPMAPTPPTGGPQAITIGIAGDRGAQSFTPNPATAAQGQSLVFRNNDSAEQRRELPLLDSSRHGRFDQRRDRSATAAMHGRVLLRMTA
jgi:hypothetical protein